VAVTATLDAALSSYRAADARLADQLGAGRPGVVVAR
jgi:hypothetical protein